jgi:hypothetical protein
MSSCSTGAGAVAWFVRVELVLNSVGSGCCVDKRVGCRVRGGAGLQMHSSKGEGARRRVVFDQC